MLTHSNILRYQFDVPYIIIDNLKNIISYKLTSSSNMEFILRNTPQIGESIVEVIPQDEAESITKLIDYCLTENTSTIADKRLVSRMVKSSNKVQILFVSLPVNVFYSYVACLFIPGLNMTNQTLVRQHHEMDLDDNFWQRPFSEEIRAHPIDRNKINNLSTAINSRIETLTKIAERLNKITHEEDHRFLASEVIKKPQTASLLREISLINPKTVRKCSYCESDAVERIPRSGFVKSVFFWIPIRRYICYSCLHKFHIIKKHDITRPHTKHIH
jgi:hypothetical protein